MAKTGDRDKEKSVTVLTDFNCMEEGCFGNVNTENPNTRMALTTGCSNQSMAYACDTCGRLHFGPETGVVDRADPPNKAFLKDGKLVKVPSAGKTGI